MSQYLKGKGAQKSIYFNCWASLPSPAYFQLRHGERGEAQKELFVRSVCGPRLRARFFAVVRSALSASLAALPTSQSISWWLGAYTQLWNCRVYI